MGAQAKVKIEFLYLEYGIMKLRHILTFRQLMYHYSIITRNHNETTFKIYRKQKESHIKCDWFATLLKDFQFIGEEMDDEKIIQYSKSQYRKIIKHKVEHAAFSLYNNSKKVKSVRFIISDLILKVI